MPTGRIIRRRRSISAKRPLLYYITGRNQLAGRSLISCIRRNIDKVDFIQIREKDLDDRALYELVSRAVSMARGKGCRILVNGRADIALAAGAHGVHLPSTGLTVRDLRRWLPNDFLVGASVHTVGEIRRVSAEGVDYVLMGHVFATKSKEGYGWPVGLSGLRRACAVSPVPVFGLGGITPDRIQAIIDAGAVGVAAITMFQSPDAGRL
ncbi:MAG: thiamine phosphate synthase [Acidobacteria bacterium]|nr:thiamine phosphate synthase [Acidobacteriota bacterium]